MKLGTFMMPLHPPEKDYTLGFEEDIEFVVRADELGFTEAWIGQHHTLAWEPIPSNDVFIANVLPRTNNIRLGSGVSILPQHHPVNVAVRLAYLDHLSRGTHQLRVRAGGRADRLGPLRLAGSGHAGPDDGREHRHDSEAVADRSAL